MRKALAAGWVTWWISAIVLGALRGANLIIDDRDTLIMAAVSISIGVAVYAYKKE